MRMSVSMFTQLLCDDLERKTAKEGVEALIRQYYADYEDATEIDGRYWEALQIVTNHGGYIDSVTLDQVIDNVEADLRENGRNVQTPGLDVEDENDE